MSITIPLSDELTRQVSDGYHTFEELYDHRILLFIALGLALQKQSPNAVVAAWKPHYPGWPVLFLRLWDGKQISYHFKEKYLPLVEGHFGKDESIEWDGHTSNDVLKRLEELLK